MAKLAKLSYKHDSIRDPEDFSDEEPWCSSDGESWCSSDGESWCSSDGESWCSSDGEPCCSSDEENPVKFENEILLGVLKKVPQIERKFWRRGDARSALKNIDVGLLSKDDACLLLEHLPAIQDVLGENSTCLFIDKVLKVPVPVSVKLAVMKGQKLLAPVGTRIVGSLSPGQLNHELSRLMIADRVKPDETALDVISRVMYERLNQLDHLALLETAFDFHWHYSRFQSDLYEFTMGYFSIRGKVHGHIFHYMFDLAFENFFIIRILQVLWIRVVWRPRSGFLQELWKYQPKYCIGFLLALFLAILPSLLAFLCLFLVAEDC